MKELLEFIEKTYPLFKNGTSNRKIRHNFFSEIKTELQAYLLGFIYSDGSINDERHTLTIHINELDEEIFNLFKIISPEAYTQNCRGYESKSLVDGRTVKNLGSIRLNISSKILLLDLHDLGVVLNKTYKELHIPKQIPNNLIKHFIRGYFDGDGCITYSIRKPNPKNREKNYRVNANVNFTAKLCNIFIDFLKYFSDNDITINIMHVKRGDMYRLLTSKRDSIIKMFHLFYDNSNFYLSRKFNKFNHYVNTEVTLLIAEYRNALEVNDNESNNPPKSVEHPTFEDENVR